MCIRDRPWGGTSKQLMHGELRCLIGHLAENDLHGKLSFIERALGISKARELYQHVEQYQLSQRELAERLRKDGYPINQSQISRMEQTQMCIRDRSSKLAKITAENTRRT